MDYERNLNGPLHVGYMSELKALCDQSGWQIVISTANRTKYKDKPWVGRIKWCWDARQPNDFVYRGNPGRGGSVGNKAWIEVWGESIEQVVKGLIEEFNRIWGTP